MRTFLALLRREARDVRALTIAMALIAPLALLAYEELAAHYSYGHYTAGLVVPALVALYAAIVASDLVAAEVSSRRIDALVALPVSLRRIWAAKVTLLGTATLAFAGWVGGAAALLYSIRTNGTNERAFFSHTTDLLVGCGAALPLGATVLFYSTLVPRGLAAALGGACTLGVAAAGLASIDWRAWEIHQGAAIVWAAPLLLSLLMGAGAYFAFTRGPIHVGSTLRRSVIAFAVPLGILIPGTAVAFAAVRAHVALEPGDAEARIAEVLVSPSGHHAALTVTKAGQKRRRAWLVDLRSGETHVLSDGPGMAAAWSEDGRCAVLEDDLVRWFDADSGEARRARSMAQLRGTKEYEPIAARLHGRTQWCTHVTRKYDPEAQEWVTTIESASGTYAVRGPTTAQPSSRPDHVLFSPERGRLVHRNLITGEDILQVEGSGSIGGHCSPDGRYLHTYETEEDVTTYRVRATEDGRVVAGPWRRQGNSGESAYVPSSGLSGWVYVYGGDSARLVCLATGAEVPVVGRTWPVPACAELPDGRLLLERDGGLDLLETDGTVSRTYLR